MRPPVAAIMQEMMTMGVILASNSAPPEGAENPPAGMVLKTDIDGVDLQQSFETAGEGGGGSGVPKPLKLDPDARCSRRSSCGVEGDERRHKRKRAAGVKETSGEGVEGDE
ncbi:hypothetical protein L1049_016389 [Liquidambar formosana]|uniref:Uncharacterized protein n=1 Tax=Liquidambar formosana TaxID=63359 RepID=A0AAP0S5Y9_LIQFO